LSETRNHVKDLSRAAAGPHDSMTMANSQRRGFAPHPRGTPRLPGLKPDQGRTRSDEAHSLPAHAMRPLGESRSGRASRCASRLSRRLGPPLRMHAAQSCGGRSAFHRRTSINPRAKAIHHAPQQGLPRQGTHDQEPLDLLQPQAGLPRPLVELRPRRALLQQFGYRHGRPPHQRRPGTRQDAEEMRSADGESV